MRNGRWPLRIVPSANRRPETPECYRKLSRLSFLYTADNVFLLRRRSGFPFLLSELLPGVGQHQLDAVLLIDRSLAEGS